MRSVFVKFLVFSVFLVQSLALCHVQDGERDEGMDCREESACLAIASESDASEACAACGATPPPCESARTCNSHSLPDDELTLARLDIPVFYAHHVDLEVGRRAPSATAGAVVPLTPSVPPSLPLLI